LPPLPLAACATAFALLMAAFLISAPFIVAFPATRWPWLGGGVGRCRVRSRPVAAQAAPHRRAVQERVEAWRRVAGKGNTYSGRDMPAVAPVCDFFNCWEIGLALVSRAYPGLRPLIGGGAVLQLRLAVCCAYGGIAGKCSNRSANTRE
jgi:hypothetical protein